MLRPTDTQVILNCSSFGLFKLNSFYPWSIGYHTFSQNNVSGVLTLRKSHFEECTQYNISLHFVLIFRIYFVSPTCKPPLLPLSSSVELDFCMMRFFKFNFFNHPSIPNCDWLSYVIGKLWFNTNYLPKLFSGTKQHFLL